MYINKLEGRVKEFALACFEFNTIDELSIKLVGGVNQDDCDYWGISADEWELAILAAIKENVRAYKKNSDY